MELDLACGHTQSILNTISEGVFTVDLDRRITSFNRAAEMITGYNRWEAQGRYCWEVVRTEVCRVKCPCQEALRTGSRVTDVQTTLLNKSAERIPVHVSTTLLENDQGEPIGAVETLRDVQELERLRKELKQRYSFEDIIGKSPPMQKLFALLPRIAESSSSVVIEGETGTGKELFAKAIHNLSPRSDQPFIAVNCGALPDALLESELFGHKAGAFTDARKDKPGRFQLAHGGTIFLDEISDISPAMQVRLLRVLQEGEVEPLGATKAVPIDVRVVVATNRPLETMVTQGCFRQDLYYRIKVIHVTLPPLRERKEDIPLLIKGLIVKYNHLQGKGVTGVSPEALARLMLHYYPGNVRELENVIEQAFVLRPKGTIQLEDLPRELQERSAAAGSGLSLEALERSAVEEALRRAGGHRGKAARELGIDPSTLYRKMKILGITPPAADGRSRKPH